ncbi:MAG TPA: hypothetical protein VF605_13460 [Allosphingosinicella sp.]|jgi:hypothetical protein
MRIAPAAAVAFTLFAASPGSAQESNDLGQVLAQMPKELRGAPVQKLPDGILMYFLTGPSGEPMVVGVSVSENKEVLSPAEIRTRLRGSRNQKSDVRQILREGTFTAPKWPGAATYFVDYEGNEFRHQNWALMSGKVGISVLVTYHSKKDAKPVEGLVAKNIFGGAVISVSKPTE